ncbi:hypothetical protein AAW00_12145 [Aurantiacibacter luteus]|uniref:Uncharacterized protein n=1 Tax=Aurantiacibacter luteus TaxID=1581420 RepID=A0A0G9MTP4_9SPHN|nr:hypothetical protein AAW00_12145 [Aurantiacibacter luteus]
MLKRAAGDDETTPSTPLGGTRAERLQRLQIGVFGILAMVLLVGLADVVTSRLAMTEAAAVPEAAPTVEATETAIPRDPLVDAGVAPEVPATDGEPGTAPAAPAPAVPRTGQNAPLQ